MKVCKQCGRKFKNKDVSLFKVCPDCKTGEYLEEVKSTYKRKYKRGDHILSLDELMMQDFIYFYDKIQHKGWFMSWQLSFVAKYIGPTGFIYYAIKNDSKTVNKRKE